jgi:hypothetical protein
MTGKESGHIDHEAAQAVPHVNPDALEIAPGTAHEHLEGWIPQLASEEEIRNALEKAFDYRGDVTITRKDGSKVEGYLFDRRTAATLEKFYGAALSQERERQNFCFLCRYRCAGLYRT